jgi:hypothetical protein
VEDTAPVASRANHAEAAISDPAMAAEPIVPMAEATEVKAEAAEAMAEIADLSPEAADVSAEAAEAHDNAVLDMIALEMAAPDPEDVAAPSDDEAYEVEAEIQAAALPSAEPIIVAEGPEPASAPAPPDAREPALQPSFTPAPEPEASIAAEPSLGSSLIASGIVRARAASRPDPLAPIRRMSQAEKIAFFS